RLVRALIHELQHVHGIEGLAWARDIESIRPWDEHHRFVKALAADLVRSRDRALLVTGERQPPEVHALVHAIEHALGAEHVTYVQPTLLHWETGPTSLRALTDEMRGG